MIFLPQADEASDEASTQRGCAGLARLGFGFSIEFLYEAGGMWLKL